MFGFHYEGMQGIIESGDCQTGVMLLKIPINLGTLAEDSTEPERSKKNTREGIKLCNYICMYTMIYTNCINFIVLYKNIRLY